MAANLLTTLNQRIVKIKSINNATISASAQKGSLRSKKTRLHAAFKSN